MEVTYTLVPYIYHDHNVIEGRQWFSSLVYTTLQACLWSLIWACHTVKLILFCSFQASSSTVTTITYTDWLTRNGVITRDVDVIVTPNVIVSYVLLYNTILFRFTCPNSCKSFAYYSLGQTYYPPAYIIILYIGQIKFLWWLLLHGQKFIFSNAKLGWELL